MSHNELKIWLSNVYKDDIRISRGSYIFRTITFYCCSMFLVCLFFFFKLDMFFSDFILNKIMPSISEYFEELQKERDVLHVMLLFLIYLSIFTLPFVALIKFANVYFCIVYNRLNDIAINNDERDKSIVFVIVAKNIIFIFLLCGCMFFLNRYTSLFIMVYLRDYRDILRMIGSMMGPMIGSMIELMGFTIFILLFFILINLPSFLYLAIKKGNPNPNKYGNPV